MKLFKKYLGAAFLALIALYAIYSFARTSSDEWEKWTFVATTAGVLVNVLFLFALLRQIKSGDRAVHMAQRAAEEARKARVDQSAPRVTVLMDKPMAISLLNPNLDTDDQNQAFRRPDTLTQCSSIGCMGRIKNEGDSTVRLLLNGPACFIEEGVDEDNMGIPFPRESNNSEEIMLEPGKVVRFSWFDLIPVQKLIDAAITPEDQNPGASSFLDIVASRPSADGIYDQVSLRLSSVLVERDPSSESLWRYRTQHEVNLSDNKFRRVYSFEPEENHV